MSFEIVVIASPHFVCVVDGNHILDEFDSELGGFAYARNFDKLLLRGVENPAQAFKVAEQILRDGFYIDARNNERQKHLNDLVVGKAFYARARVAFAQALSVPVAVVFVLLCGVFHFKKNLESG